MEENLEKNNNKKSLVLTILGTACIVILIGIIVLILNNGKKETNGGNTSKDDPFKQNEVVLDGFTYSFLKLETKKNNLVYSPLSIKYALSMLNEGANGKTKEEIDALIKELSLTKYENIDKVLSLANSIFIRDTYKDSIDKDYINTLKEKYNAEVLYDKFKDAKNVNEWIENKTFNLIKNMLQDEQVQDGNVKFLLINALAIDMEWQAKFEKNDTTSSEFTKEDGTKVNVAMMHKGSDSNYFYLDDDYTLLSMPLKSYNGTQLEFISIMPNEKDLNEILTSDDLTKTITDLLDKLHVPASNQKLSISMPKFDYEYSAKLKTDLQTMKMETAFTSAADFYKIGTTGLYVDDVLHKAKIECSENGIKAAAATVIIMKDNAFMVEPTEYEYIKLIFDKPFMYIIRDVNTKEVWFVGTVYEPILWETVKTDYESK